MGLYKKTKKKPYESQTKQTWNLNYGHGNDRVLQVFTAVALLKNSQTFFVNFWLSFQFQVSSSSVCENLSDSIIIVDVVYW